MTAITSSGASETDRARNLTLGWIGLIASMTALPPPPGMCTSSSTTSGSRSAISSMAAGTSSASPTTSTASPSSLRPAADRLRDAFSVVGYRLGVEAGTTVSYEHGHAFRLDLDVDGHRARAGPLCRVDGRLLAGGQKCPQLFVERGVADGDGVDGDAVGGFDLALDLLDSCRQRCGPLSPERPRRPALEQP